MRKERRREESGRAAGNARRRKKAGTEGKPRAQSREPTGRRSLRRKAESDRLHCQEKLLTRNASARTKTDTGRRGENPKVRGKTPVKELGKMHP